MKSVTVTYYLILKVTSNILYYILFAIKNNSLGNNITSLHNIITSYHFVT